MVDRPATPQGMEVIKRLSHALGAASCAGYTGLVSSVF